MTPNNRSTAHFVLENDTFDPEDETVSSEELTRDLEAALQAKEAHSRGEVPVRVTEVQNGKQVTYWRYSKELAG
jgi:hypothetical protein